MVIYILTKFGADWLIFVDARVLTKNCGWTDGQTDAGHRRTMSDHNCSLSTPCSVELKNIVWKGENIGSQHFLLHLQILPDDKFKTSKVTTFADDNFKFNENGRTLSKRVENTMGKGEIARYEQFLLFPQCFHKVCFPGASKGVVEWEWVNNFLDDSTPLIYTHTQNKKIIWTKYSIFFMQRLSTEKVLKLFTFSKNLFLHPNLKHYHYSKVLKTITYYQTTKF